MTEIEPYAIAGIETVNIEQGSDQLPYFYKITSGQKDTRSLVFHAKIKTEYHQYTICQVNKKSLNLACSLRKCKAKATVKISPDLILPGAGKLRNNKIRSTFKVDFSNPRMRELSNYDVIPNSSPSHCHLGVKSGFLRSAQRDFRERHSRLAVATGKTQVDTVLDLFRLRTTYGIQNESEVLGRKKMSYNQPIEKLKDHKFNQKMASPYLPNFVIFTKVITKISARRPPSPFIREARRIATFSTLSGN